MSDAVCKDPEHHLNAAKVRHGHSVVCDRCGDALTLSSMTMATLAPHLLRTALELGWQLSVGTFAGLGSSPLQRHDSDHCPACRRLLEPVQSTTW